MKIIKKDSDIISYKDINQNSIVLFEMSSGTFVLPTQVKAGRYMLISIFKDGCPNRWVETTYSWEEVMNMVGEFVGDYKVINAYLFDNMNEVLRFILNS